MRLADWLVLCSSLAFVVLYGLWRGRGSNSVDKYLLAGKTMPWHAMALSIMATQASAVTFISTTGQSYVDGMRFVQFYFGLPLAMVVLAVTAVPIFHRANVYTAYEYLEQRFDSRTRALVSVIFLIQRGLALGITLYAPAVVLTVILGWPVQWTTLIMGAVADPLHHAWRRQDRGLERLPADAGHDHGIGGGARRRRDAPAARRIVSGRRLPGRGRRQAECGHAQSGLERPL